MISTIDLVFVLVFLFAVQFLLRSKKKYKFPPGPWNIPFFGGLYSTNPHLDFQEWAKKYGPLIRTKFGLQDVLVIDDAQIMREAFNNNAFSGRMDYKLFTFANEGKHGLGSSEGQEWIEQRRFALRTLRNFGLGKRSMETLIMNEVKDFLKWIKVKEGVPTEVKPRLVLAAVSTIWTMVAGERQSQNDEELQAIIEKSSNISNEIGKTNGILMIFPKLIDILPKVFLKSWYQLLEANKPLQEIHVKAIESHIKNPVDPLQPRDLIDAYLTEIEKTTDPNSSFYGERGFKTLKFVISDLFAAGQGTTSSILAWGFIYLVRFPNEQKKFQTEMNNVIGPNRLPSLDDRPKLPYSNALILEILRFSTLGPLGFFHETTEDTTLRGYDIKKGTVVIPNVYSMNFSKKTYIDPESFRPERFLSLDGKSVVTFEEFTPFGTGKRICLGESMARDSLFLFLTSIFHRFDVGQDTSKPPPSLEPSPGLLREPQKFSVVFKEKA